MTQKLDLTVKRGCTLQSGKLISVNEPVPKNITYAQLLAGIADDTYTLKSLADKTYSGQVRDRANATLRGQLVFDTTDDMLSFSLPASVTETWENKADTFYYDVIETDTVTNQVVSRVEGKISVVPTVTKEVV